MPVRVGIDLVQIEEIRDSVAAYGERYLERDLHRRGAA